MLALVRRPRVIAWLAQNFALLARFLERNIERANGLFRDAPLLGEDHLNQLVNGHQRLVTPVRHLRHADLLYAGAVLPIIADRRVALLLVRNRLDLNFHMYPMARKAS